MKSLTLLRVAAATGPDPGFEHPGDDRNGHPCRLGYVADGRLFLHAYSSAWHCCTCWNVFDLGVDLRPTPMGLLYESCNERLLIPSGGWRWMGKILRWWTKIQGARDDADGPQAPCRARKVRLSSPCTAIMRCELRFY